jgi:hypothetical protein
MDKISVSSLIGVVGVKLLLLLSLPPVDLVPAGYALLFAAAARAAA